MGTYTGENPTHKLEIILSCGEVILLSSDKIQISQISSVIDESIDSDFPLTYFIHDDVEYTIPLNSLGFYRESRISFSNPE